AGPVLDAMIGGKGLMRKDGLRLRDIFADESLLGKVEAALAEAEYKTRLIPDEEQGLSAIEVKNVSGGGGVLINGMLASDLYFERAISLYKSFLQPIPPPYLIKESDVETEVKSRGELLDRFLSLGQKELAAQRFEHLGEMNPQVFWDTTLNPEKR